MPPLTVIKLGGAAVTDPDGPDGLDHNTVSRLAREIATLPTDVILVHGTGAVGKPAAHEHDFVDTGILPKEKSLVSCDIHHRLRSLNQRFIQTLINHDLPAVGVDPATTLTRDFSNISGSHAQDHLTNLVTHRVIPVLYGDMITTDNGSFKVLSSDIIAAILARELKAQHLIFLTNVPGVYSTSDHSSANAPIHDTITTNDLQNPDLFGQSDQQDVSGGMQAKIQFALESSRDCQTCWIGNAHTEGILTEFFRTNTITGTRILAH